MNLTSHPLTSSTTLTLLVSPLRISLPLSPRRNTSCVTHIHPIIISLHFPFSPFDPQGSLYIQQISYIFCVITIICLASLSHPFYLFIFVTFSHSFSLPSLTHSHSITRRDQQVSPRLVESRSPGLQVPGSRAVLRDRQVAAICSLNHFPRFPQVTHPKSPSHSPRQHSVATVQKESQFHYRVLGCHHHTKPEYFAP